MRVEHGVSDNAKTCEKELGRKTLGSGKITEVLNRRKSAALDDFGKVCNVRMRDEGERVHVQTALRSYSECPS